MLLPCFDIKLVAGRPCDAEKSREWFKTLYSVDENKRKLVSANVHLMIYELVLSEPSILTLLTILHRPYWKGGFNSECGLKHQESYNLLIRIFILH